MLSPASSPPAPAVHTIMAAVVQLFLNFGLKHGLDPDRLCADAGITQAQLARPERHVPFVWLASISDAIVAALPEVAVGIELGLFSSPDQGVRQGYLGQALKFVATPLAGLELVVRCLRHVDTLLALDPPRVQLLGSTVVYELPMARPIPREFFESFLVSTLVSLRAQAPAPIVVHEVRLARTPATLRARLERLFGAPVRFGAACDALVLARAPLEVPVPSAAPEVARRFEEQFTRRMEASGDQLALAVQLVVEAELARGSLSQERVAKTFGLSARSLQRRLQERGVRYYALVEQARKAQAERLLADPSLHIGEVASAMGYDLSSFDRVFRRWSGMTPRAYRKTQATSLARRRVGVD